MGSLRFLALLVLLLSLSLFVFADTSNDATRANDEAKPSEATNAIEPQQRGQTQAAEAKSEANDVVVEPQQRWGGGCRYGCCGGWQFGRCRYCCNRPQDVESKAAEANEVVEAVEPQQRCRYCCGSYAYGQCSACCSKKMFMEIKKKKEEAKP